MFRNNFNFNFPRTLNADSGMEYYGMKVTKGSDSLSFCFCKEQHNGALIASTPTKYRSPRISEVSLQIAETNPFGVFSVSASYWVNRLKRVSVVRHITKTTIHTHSEWWITIRSGMHLVYSRSSSLRRRKCTSHPWFPVVLSSSEGGKCFQSPGKCTFQFMKVRLFVGCALPHASELYPHVPGKCIIHPIFARPLPSQLSSWGGVNHGTYVIAGRFTRRAFWSLLSTSLKVPNKFARRVLWQSKPHNSFNSRPLVSYFIFNKIISL